MAKMIKTYKGDLVEYEIFNLVDFYDPILRQPCVPVKFDTPEDLKRNHFLAFSMAETLAKYEGLGLSANQVGLKEKVCAVNMGEQIWTLFNPEIIERSEELSTEFTEGCLSYPGSAVVFGANPAEDTAFGTFSGAAQTKLNSLYTESGIGTITVSAGFTTDRQVYVPLHTGSGQLSVLGGSAETYGPNGFTVSFLRPAIVPKSSYVPKSMINPLFSYEVETPIEP